MILFRKIRQSCRRDGDLYVVDGAGRIAAHETEVGLPAFPKIVEAGRTLTVCALQFGIALAGTIVIAGLKVRITENRISLNNVRFLFEYPLCQPQ